MTARHTYITGWDIGGAHLKAARCDNNGRLIAVLEIVCPIWHGLDYLRQAIRQIQSQLNNHTDHAAITMTAELADIFADRQAGVAAIVDVICEFFQPAQTHVYAAELNWLTPAEAKQNWQAVASQNWHASATFVAKQLNAGLFIDIGSTSCDIIPFKQGSVCAIGQTDYQRQISRELLYTGAIRTPLIALANSAPFEDHDIGLAAEVFATTADAWCLIGELDKALIKDDSADGRPWQKEDCQRRIARLLGTDAKHHDDLHWQQLAQWFADIQVHLVTSSIVKVQTSHPDISPETPIVGAGVGRFIIKKCAQSLGHDYIDFSTLVHPELSSAADHAPATAVALLAQQSLT